jgi:hypothetical protein
MVAPAKASGSFCTQFFHDEGIVSRTGIRDQIPPDVGCGVRFPAMQILADLVVHGGNLITLDRARARATGMAVRGGRIEFVGDDRQLDLTGRWKRHVNADQTYQSLMPTKAYQLRP